MSQGGESMITAVKLTSLQEKLFYALVCQTSRLVSFVSMVCCESSESSELSLVSPVSVMSPVSLVSLVSPVSLVSSVSLMILRSLSAGGTIEISSLHSLYQTRTCQLSRTSGTVLDLLFLSPVPHARCNLP